ncbi:GntR family transcriptional regulator [Arthrobacter mobilis]|uniref:GntR family transcriptional regulator n=1 Tax=Arthrobacter mobilis TaxID=2724944 RepID=A0A7X6HEX3_9MICC|nr:GntR family transcriptional regulator [Arthrobacter mobilis]NKX54422.1 GntR family transcriptional regulator [Arthrobacter mobilis]
MDATPVKRMAAPLRQEVTEALRRAIVTSEFSPGERLVESTLCDKFDVSRTVIREALRQLETEGLISIVPNRGPEVATLSMKQAEDLYEARQALESKAGALFAERATDAQCTELLSALNEVKAAVADGDPNRNLAVKDRFYEVLLAGSGNAEIQRMLKIVNARIQMLRMYSLASPDRGAHTVAELTRITAAAAVNRDPDEAARACNDHVRNAAAAGLAELRRILEG